jgi:anaerobic magnesium-protoporphyrin IX monomethyl ester cyclase
MSASAPSVVLLRPPLATAPVFSKQVENLGLAYVTADLRKRGHDAEILDGMLLGWSVEESAREVMARKPDVVGITVVNNYFPDTVRETCRLLRDGGFGGRIVIGGHSTSFIPAEILTENAAVDAVLVGEGERSFADFLAVWQRPDRWSGVSNLAYRGNAGNNSGPIVRNKARRITDLDSLPLPARDMTPTVIARDGLVAVSTSRGCQARCTFCSVPRFFGLEHGGNRPAGWLARSAESVADELTALVEDFGVREVLMVDDEFFGGSGIGLDRGARIASALRDRELPVEFALSCRAESVDATVLSALREVGLRHVFIGVEFGNERDAKLYGKDITLAGNRRAVETVRELGLSLGCGFIMFNHDSDLDLIAENFEFLDQIGELKPMVLATSLGPHYGTPALKLLERRNRLRCVGSGYDFEMDDLRAIALRALAECVSNAFIPYAEKIVAIRSGITFEWRRPVPQRTAETERALDAVEKRVSDSFAAIVVAGLDALRGLPPTERIPPELFVRSYDSALAAAARDADVAFALAALRVRGDEGQVKYYSQNECPRRIGSAERWGTALGGAT